MAGGRCGGAGFRSGHRNGAGLSCRPVLRLICSCKCAHVCRGRESDVRVQDRRCLALTKSESARSQEPPGRTPRGSGATAWSCRCGKQRHELAARWCLLLRPRPAAPGSQSYFGTHVGCVLGGRMDRFRLRGAGTAADPWAALSLRRRAGAGGRERKGRAQRRAVLPRLPQPGGWTRGTCSLLSLPCWRNELF